MTAAPPDLVKQRELVFSAKPPGQVEHALQLLSGVEGLKVERSARPNCLKITYSLVDYALEGIEQALEDVGFRLEGAALKQLGKRFTHYLEQVEYHNLNVPEWHSKNRRSEAFVHAYEHHLHGDHDDTPPELREYR